MPRSRLVSLLVAVFLCLALPPGWTAGAAGAGPSGTMALDHGASHTNTSSVQVVSAVDGAAEMRIKTEWVSASLSSGSGTRGAAIKSDGSLWVWGWNYDGRLGEGTKITRVRPARVGTGTDWASFALDERWMVAIKRDGTLWAWGENASGQLGDGTTTAQSTPKRIGTDTDWKAVSAGTGHAVALKRDGSLWAWGANAAGQLGDGTTTARLTPARIGAATDWATVQAGPTHTVALRTDGSLWAWGSNGSGQLGDGTTTNRSVPTSVGADVDWAFISTGEAHTVGRKRDGSAWAWGSNGSGRLGDGTTTSRSTPTRIGTDTDWETVAAGGSHTVATKRDGSLWAWGSNTAGQLGDGTTTGKSTPTRIGADGSWGSVSASYVGTFAIRRDGSLWTWGANWAGQLGDGTRIDRTTPSRVFGFEQEWRSASAGLGYTVAVKPDGTIWSWGGNGEGQLGDGTRNSRPRPAKVGTDSDWATASAGVLHTVAIKTDGTLWTWGANWAGQLGDGTTTARLTPTRIGTATDWVAVSGGESFTVALKRDGALWAWGSNDSGQLGDGTSVGRLSPARVGAASDWAAIAAGGHHVMALKTNGGLWAWGLDTGATTPTRQAGTTEWTTISAGLEHNAAFMKTPGQPALHTWGRNGSGQLGDGTTTDRLTPGPIANGDPFFWWTAVSLGPDGRSTLALKNDGSLWAWGDNAEGLLGDGTKTNRPSPVRIGGEEGYWLSMSTNITHSVAISSDGRLWTWGDNASGQLGDGTTYERLSPVPVADNGWRALAADDGHTVGTKADGSLWAWGANASGQLGDGTTRDRLAPVRIGADADWAVVSTGEDHTVARKQGGSLWAWGANGSGQIGDGTVNARTSPVRIGTESDWAAASAGERHTVAIKSNGSLWAWGENSSGQLGDGTVGDKSAPVRIGTDSDWAAVAAGDRFTVARKTNGSLWAWGDNSSGQLGDGSTTGRLTPGRVGLDTNWSALCPGGAYVVATRGDGTLWGWGENASGQLGDGTTTRRLAPVKVTTETGWASISAADVHAVAVKWDGSLWSWGDNASGQLGDGTTSARLIPTRVGTAVDWAAPCAGSLHSAGLKAGELYAWGDNGSGQLGDGATIGRSRPSWIPDATWSAWEPYVPMRQCRIPPGDGTKTVTVQYRDPTLISLTLSDDIILDMTPPRGSFSIKGGAASTGQRAVTLNSNVAEATGMRFRNAGGAWPAWEVYAATKSWTLTAGDGAKTVEAQYRDDVGNILDAADGIMLVSTPPVAVSDDIAMAEDASVATAAPGILSNDSDANGDAITAVRLTSPAHGTLAFAGSGAITYTPDPDYNGTDTFTYRAWDGSAYSQAATVTIHVAPVNDAPVATADTADTSNYATLTVEAPGVLSNDRDVDRDDLSAERVSGPSHGTLALNADGSYAYRPARGYVGTDGFTYRASDGSANSSVVSVSITVWGRDFVEIQGPDRYATAVATSKRAFPDSASVVVLATGANWPDALGGGALAAAKNGPILLTRKDSIPDTVAAEIERLQPAEAIVLGSEGVVSAEVFAALERELGEGNVTRIGGDSRYETADMIAAEVVAAVGGDYDGTCFVTTGVNFPDALGASPLAAAKGWPILLVPPTGMAPSTVKAMEDLGVTDVLILGSERAVSSAVEGDLGGAYTTSRLEGANRYSTAKAIAEYGVAHCDMHWDDVALATGQNFPDALAGGVLQGREGSVMLLTPSTVLHEAARDSLSANKASIAAVRFLGSESALNVAVRGQVAAALE